ncbi:putative ORFan [Tupanvirus deep ocean]|uniref:ORFan n=2 Tax=Tupanvirus TaxID=2094720 RepID=A0AC62A6Z4_9VIRU|nr:putative ORFan [Tupanvirus deep ocean]QKU33551.1 putative ORFan [Tupanvirus deep ocean]
MSEFLIVTKEVKSALAEQYSLNDIGLAMSDDYFNNQGIILVLE